MPKIMKCKIYIIKERNVVYMYFLYLYIIKAILIIKIFQYKIYRILFLLLSSLDLIPEVFSFVQQLITQVNSLELAVPQVYELELEEVQCGADASQQ